MRLFNSMRRHAVPMQALSLALSVFMAASGQQPAQRTPPPVPNNAPGTNAPAEGAVATFKTATNLVTLEVTVLDKNNKSVAGLKPEDFIVTEDGVAQQVTFLQYENIPDEHG